MNEEKPFTTNPVFDRLADVWKAEPLLYDELIRRRQSILQKIEDANGQNHELSYNDLLFRIHDLHTSAMEGHFESMLLLSEQYRRGDGVSEDPLLAFRLVRLLAEQEFQQAFPALGRCYAFGLGTSINPTEAVHWLLQTDYSQETDILAFLGWCYHVGIGLPKDEQKAWDYYVDVAEKGVADGFRFCKIAADAGHARGQYVLGLFYQHGIDVPANIQMALHLFHLSANQNYSPAQCSLGVLYSEGEVGIERAPEIAVQWFRRAAAQNDPAAQHRLAHCLATGTGTMQNLDGAVQLWRDLARENHEYPDGEQLSQYELGKLLIREAYSDYRPAEGVEWLRRSAEQGYAPAQSVLGMLYRTGLGKIVKQNEKESRFWFKKAATQGNCVAQYHLGEIYFEGTGVRENHQEGFKWYKQSSEGGYVPARQKLAHCYLNGIGTQKNDDEGYGLLTSLALCGDEEALTLLQSAATSGNAAAEFGMWVYHYNKHDTETGYHWLEKAADQEHCNALYTMAVRYENEGNDPQKFRHFRRAAKKGHADAQYQLGLLLENGVDGKDNKEAFLWMKRAADQQHAGACYCLGNFYRDGTWVDIDDHKAFKYYSKAADLGNPDGLERLGAFYANGIVVPEDADTAFRCFHRSAESGNPQGQCQLGLCYLVGRGCRQDMEVAFQWITSAASTGHPGVVLLLKQVGLDIEKLIGGYQQTWNRFGENIEQIFSKP